MDFEFEDRFRDLMKLKPSEYWRRQCRCTFQFDPIGAKLIDEIGVETMMWGSDYPHTDGVWPESHEIHRGAVRRSAGRHRAQDHLRERRQVLPPGELVGDSLSAPWGGEGRGEVGDPAGKWVMSLLEEKDAIREVLAEYCFRLDGGDYDGMAALFTEDGTWDTAFGKGTGRAAIAQLARDIRARAGDSRPARSIS